MDKQLEKMIQEELNSKYWQDIINYKGFSKNCDLELLEYQFDEAKLLFHFSIRYKGCQLQVSFTPQEIGLKTFESQQFDIVLLRTRIAEELIKKQLEYYDGHLPIGEGYKEQTAKIEDGESDNVVSNIVYIETKMSSIILENIRPEEITKEAFNNGDLFINFGNKVSIKSDSFISYEICDSKK